MYIDCEVKFKIVLGGQIGSDSPCDDIGVDFNHIVISKILDQTVANQPVGLVDEYPVLVWLRHRRVVFDFLLLHYLISVAIIHLLNTQPILQTKIRTKEHVLADNDLIYSVTLS